MPSLNLYAIRKTKTNRSPRYFEYAESVGEAMVNFREYWNQPTAPLSVELMQSDVQKPLEAPCQ